MKVGIVGTGAMGSMLVRSCFRFQRPGSYELFASNRGAAQLEELKRLYPALTVCSTDILAHQCSVVFLCVGPRDYLPAARAMASALRRDQLLVCISNGVDLSQLAEAVPSRIVKMIPNVANSEGRGVALIVRGPRCTDDDLGWVESFMFPMSTPIRIDPVDSRAATNIAGCGHALLAQFCASLVEASAQYVQHLSTAQLLSMTQETLIATARMLEAGKTFEAIVAQARTGGGMTEIAVQHLAKAMREPLRHMVEATIDREKSLKEESRNTSMKETS